MTFFCATGCDKGDAPMQVDDIDPRNGPLQGEQPIRIHGEHFRTDVGYTVYFGTQKASSVTILNEETLVVSLPPKTEPGAVDVVVQSDRGAGFRLKQAFHYRDMSGSVVEKLGEQGSGQGSLKY